MACRALLKSITMRQTQDPQAREKLLQEHWTSMQNAMNTMYVMGGPMMDHGMMGPSMMGAGHMGSRMMGGPMMWGDYRNLPPEQLRQRQYMMGAVYGDATDDDGSHDVAPILDAPESARAEVDSRWGYAGYYS